MRRFVIAVFFLAFATCLGAAKDESVEQLKSRFESARPDDRPGLCILIAQQQLRSADKFFLDGDVDQANAAIDDIVSYSEKAREAAAQSKKHLKSVEIDVRKIADRLRDIKRTLAFDDQAPVDMAIRRLEDVRTALLKEMFGKDNKKEKQ